MIPARFWRLVFAVMLLMSACSSAPPPPPTTYSVSLEVSSDLNPNSAGQASPAVVRVYELKTIDQFQTADFFSLFDQDARLLANSMTNRRELIVRPGETQTIDGSSVNDQVRFIAVMVGYRDIQAATWRASVQIQSNKYNKFIFRLEQNAVSYVKPEPPPKASWFFF